MVLGYLAHALIFPLRLALCAEVLRCLSKRRLCVSSWWHSQQISDPLRLCPYVSQIISWFLSPKDLGRVPFLFAFQALFNESFFRSTALMCTSVPKIIPVDMTARRPSHASGSRMACPHERDRYFLKTLPAMLASNFMQHDC